MAHSEDASTSVPASATQPPASQLLDDRGFARALAELETSSRVRLETIGRSHEGRPIVLIVVGMPEAVADLERHRRVSEDVDALETGGKLPALFAGDSWGHEASQVEGLIKAAHTLAFDDSDEVRQALSGTIALIVPLMNPDGRAAAIREWQKTPLSAGDSGAGNAYGFLLNRDFVHGTQPEGRSIIETVMRWRPVAALDLHEDMFNLGVRQQEVAFVEPFAPGFDVQEHPLTRAAIVDLGRAIATRWRQQGFKVAFDEAGDNSFAPLQEPGKGLNPVASSAGRLNLMATLHGIPSFITESARTPGAQSWEDRVEQKASAVMATLIEISSRPQRYLAAVRDRRLADLEAAGDGFVVIPESGQPQDGRAALLDLLTLHGVRVGRVQTPYPAFVVKLAQPESRIARHFLLAEGSKLNEAPPALGVRVVSSAALSEDERRRFSEASAEPAVLSLPAPPEGPGPYSVRPTVRATVLVNRLLASGAARVFAQDGSFLVSGGSAAIRWEAAKLGVPLEAAAATKAEAEGRELRPARIALYTGQGIPHGEGGEIAWALDLGGFAYRRLEAADFAREDGLAGVDVLIVPNGSATEIVNGWSPEAANRKAPWEMAEQPAGLGEDGLAKIRSFVEAGGTYAGLGGGGALLAGREYLGIADVDFVPASVGLGQVRLKAVQPGSPLLLGYAVGQPIPAFFSAPPRSPDGFAFRGGASAVALYDGADDLPEEQSFLTTEPLSAEAGNAAIVEQTFGRGRVVLIGIAPAYRAQWPSTYRLLYNLLYLWS